MRPQILSCWKTCSSFSLSLLCLHSPPILDIKVVWGKRDQINLVTDWKDQKSGGQECAVGGQANCGAVGLDHALMLFKGRTPICISVNSVTYKHDDHLLIQVDYFLFTLKCILLSFQTGKWHSIRCNSRKSPHLEGFVCLEVRCGEGWSLEKWNYCQCTSLWQITKQILEFLRDVWEIVLFSRYKELQKVSGWFLYLIGHKQRWQKKCMCVKKTRFFSCHCGPFVS